MVRVGGAERWGESNMGWEQHGVGATWGQRDEHRESWEGEEEELFSHSHVTNGRGRRKRKLSKKSDYKYVRVDRPRYTI